MKNELSLSKKLIDTNNDQENFEPMKFQLQTDLSSSLKFRRNLSSSNVLNFGIIYEEYTLHLSCKRYRFIIIDQT